MEKKNRSQIAKKNRRDGNKVESWVISQLSKLFNYLIPFNNKNFNSCNIGSTRMFSRHLDGMKQDIWFKEHFQDVSIQCKKSLTKSNSIRNIDVSSLSQMDKSKLRILVTKLTKRPNVNESTIGHFVTMEWKDFEKFLIVWEQHQQHNI